MEKITTTYQDVFQGLGCMEGTLRLEVDKSVAPSIMPPRRVPLSLKERLKQELTRLERANVIKREEEPTDWVSSLVVTEKPNGKLRVCIDSQRLNTALKRSHYPLPVIEDILPELADVKVFSKADLKDGFLQIQLDEDSSKLTTFQTPWGRYRYLRMPFGISPAPECFQRKLDQNLEGLEGIYKVADDILITGRGACKEEAVRNHDANLLKLLERCRERNLKLNREKLQLKCTETTFIGHVLTPEGVKPDPSKVEAILKMERPSDVAAVRRLVGLTNYLSKFLSQLSELCEPLRRLTHKDVEWSWSAEQEKAFENVKRAVTSAPVLRYFNSSEPVEGQGDASANGIGFVLMQNGQPVSYSSRALTTSERNYSQIEKELLAQVFGVERNHHCSAKELPPLSTGEIVRVKPADRSGQWFKARVEQQVDVRSYEVRTEDGKIFRRNRRHLRNSMEPACTGGSPEPIHMPDRTQLFEGTTSSKSTVIPPKTSAPTELPPPKEARGATCSKKPESSPKPLDKPEQPPAPKPPADRPVTRSGRTPRPPSHLKDFVLTK